jgi:chemotaxis protein histidine kinase CheA
LAVAKEGHYVCVVVVHHKDEYIGIIVDEIIDTVEEEVAYNKTLSRNVVIATTVIKGKVTEILDLSKILEHFWPPKTTHLSLEPSMQQIEQRGGL